ncbi:MAG TPA: hypoxanthine phosphoribosyltransferase [Microthrixaceae bacterium]|nr:hypoxanthine phosphoribosyltransferase [Microthrixaceae bacterium]HNI36353.1 hypoxanthine phosphoribosyltransferase [Microthrixaceae bacterium]
MSFASDDSELGEVLLTAEQIHDRIAELGAQLTRDYAGRTPLLVCVLKGSFVFVADLARAVDLPVELDFIAVSSYGSSTRTSGVVRLVKDLDSDIGGRDVILVEDIVDSGLTLRYLRRNLEARNPASLAVCTLIARESADIASLDVGYVGFTIADDDWLVGYGLDVAQRYRNLGYLAKYIRPEG